MAQGSPETSAAARRPLEAEEVAAYLASHPDFLMQHSDLLTRLAPPPAEREDGVVDLRSYMVERLRAEVDRLRETQRDLIDASRANQNSRNRVHAAALFLLDAETLEHLIQTITTDLAVLLDLDVAGLLVESNGRDFPHVLRSGVRVVPEGSVHHWLEGRDVRLDADIQGEAAIFGPGAGLVRSQALVRLDVSSETPPAMLALGSREPQMFEDGMGTELISFLARVLERCIRFWLDLPA
jgi:hypothetical protein